METLGSHQEEISGPVRTLLLLEVKNQSVIQQGKPNTREGEIGPSRFLACLAAYLFDAGEQCVTVSGEPLPMTLSCLLGLITLTINN